MTTTVLGSYSFTNTPDVNGTPVLLNGGGTPQISSDVFASRPPAGVTGNLFVATDTKQVYRDNGTTWDLLSAGEMVQSFSSSITFTTGTTTKTDANTTPVSTDGTQVWSQSITPSATTSKVNIHGSVVIDHGTNNRRVILAVFRGTTCIGVAAGYIITAGQFKTVPISFTDSPASTAAQTYTIRVWGSASGTWYVGRGVTAYYNGMLANQSIIVSELA
jgi:hypothetical protein